MLKLCKTISPYKLLHNDCVTLYINFLHRSTGGRVRAKLRIEEYEDEDVIMIQNLKGMGKVFFINDFRILLCRNI